MSSRSVGLCAVLSAVALAGCAAFSSADRQTARAGSECPSLEGYPDCQNGYHVDAEHLGVDFVADRARVEDLQARYMQALDEHDADAFVACFTADGELDVGDERHKGQSALRLAIAGLPRTDAKGISGDGNQNAPASRHLITNLVLDIDGAKATDRVYWMEVSQDKQQVEASGYFEDHLVRRNDRWLFTQRQEFGARSAGAHGPTSAIK